MSATVMVENYDLICIGSGPAGQSAAELAADFGFRVAVIEKDTPGGTVTTTGGVPTKTLREAALYFSGLRDGGVYGLRSSQQPEVAVDLIRQRTREVSAQLQEATRKSLLQHGIDFIQGTARLTPNGEVSVVGEQGERILRGQMTLIATGSRPWRPGHIPFDLRGVCDTDTVLQRGWVPRHIVIVGGGAVGVEFATICHALDCKVSIVDRGFNLLPRMDREIVERLRRTLESWKVDLYFETTVHQVRPEEGVLHVELSNGVVLHPDTLLFAAGRTPNTEGLGLREAGVELDDRGRVVVDAYFRTTRPGIYAVGDVLRPSLASIAMEQGRIAVCHAFDIPFEGTVDPTPVSAVYAMPEISGSGLTEEQCLERGLDYAIARCDLAATPRGAIAGHGGLLKLLFTKQDRRIVGVHCIGDIASEIIGLGQMVIRCGGTLDTLANMSFNTPTYSYAYKYAALDGLRLLLAHRRQGETHEFPSEPRADL